MGGMPMLEKLVYVKNFSKTKSYKKIAEFYINQIQQLQEQRLNNYYGLFSERDYKLINQIYQNTKRQVII